MQDDGIPCIRRHEEDSVSMDINEVLVRDAVRVAD